MSQNKFSTIPVSKIISVIPGILDVDKKLIEKAYLFAEKAHEGQKRFSGEPYFNHVSNVAFSLAEIGLDAQVVTAGVLHDTIEDCATPPETLEKEFGSEIRGLVEGVTKLGHVKYHGIERHAESLRKLFAATSRDVRVMIIKLMDRLHNASTLEFVRPDKQNRIALETIEIYAPIAHRLGMTKIAHDLEDAVFPYAFPDRYKEVRQNFKDAGGEDQERIKEVRHAIQKKITEYGVKNFRTEARTKSLYSFSKKLARKENEASQIMDIHAVRIIVPTIPDCYTILGIIHAEWRPVPGRIKDFIAVPKPNGYRGVHTTVLYGDGGVIEIQIRTEEMHRDAQFGIASHFAYKEERAEKDRGQSTGLKWIKQFFPLVLREKPKTSKDKSNGIYTDNSAPEWLKKLGELKKEGKTEEYLSEMKNDFFSYRMFVFTPKGDVIDLPIGATPIDFAYNIHTDLANKMSGAKVNGKLISLDSPLKNGDIVDILQSGKSRPTRKWLDSAKTTIAKKHIRAAIADEKKEK